MTEEDPRRLALDVLLAVECRGKFADAALGDALARTTMTAGDRRLAAGLVYGTLAWRLRLDHTIHAYARRRRLDARVATVLRLGLFQVALLDRMADYAAVDTTVSLVKSVAPHASGFVNAILRRATRDGLAALPRSDPERTAVRLSHPAWLVQLWRTELGADEAAALMSANNEPMPTVLRALIPRTQAIEELTARGLDACPGRLAPQAIVCSLPVAIAGVAVPQSEASQLVSLMVGAGSSEQILDACAAPGGKACHLAALVGHAGRVVAVDCGEAAGERIRAACDHAGVDNVEFVGSKIEDACDIGTFDAALVDAPCSGLGTLREHPEIRWRRKPEDITALARHQRKILEAAAARVRPGGRLVYSTCTLTRSENDEIVDSFLSDHEEFEPAITASLHPALQPLLDAAGRLRTFPHRHNTGGFFAATLRRSR